MLQIMSHYRTMFLFRGLAAILFSVLIVAQPASGLLTVV